MTYHKGSNYYYLQTHQGGFRTRSYNQVQQWLDDHARFEVILLPPRSPQMNPVEDIWRHVKNRVAANLTRTLDALANACDCFFQAQSPHDLKRLAGLYDLA